MYISESRLDEDNARPISQIRVVVLFQTDSPFVLKNDTWRKHPRTMQRCYTTLPVFCPQHQIGVSWMVDLKLASSLGYKSEMKEKQTYHFLNSIVLHMETVL